MAAQYRSEQLSSVGKDGVIGKSRSYGEVVAFLNSRTYLSYGDSTTQRVKILDKQLDNITKKLDLILIAGSNGKGVVSHFTRKLLEEEGFKVGVVYRKFFSSYNDQISINNESITNKQFVEIANRVIDLVELNNIDATTFEILIMIAALYFHSSGVDVAIFEAGIGGEGDATSVLEPKVCAITNIAREEDEILGSDLDEVAYQMIDLAKRGGYLVSSEQSKLRLKKMEEYASQRGVNWVMPIRKLSSLPYIYEQLYGKSAALSERIAQIYVENIKGKVSPFLRGNIILHLHGQRGRPSLEVKRKAQLNPIKPLKSFWHENFSLREGYFQLLEKEKPTLLIDSSTNIEALSSLFLGIRLINYNRHIRGLSLVMRVRSFVEKVELIKQLRYLFKRIPGQVFLVQGNFSNEQFVDAQELADMLQAQNIKAKVSSSFYNALSEARATVDERSGLVCLTGSHRVVNEYFNLNR